MSFSYSITGPKAPTVCCRGHARAADRLISFSQLPNVRLGIIGFETRYVTAPWHGFWLYDQERVVVETFSAALDLRQPQEIELYANAFAELATVASYGWSARVIINRVSADLAPEVPEGAADF